MIKAILCLVLIAFASAQFNQNFTQIYLGWESQSVRVVPENITDPDGTTWFQLQRGTNNQGANEWTLDLIGADGSISHIKNINNDLVLVAPNGAQSSISKQIPSLVGLNGGILVAAVTSGVKDAVTSTFGNPNLHRITTAQANTGARGIVDAILSKSTLPSFFLTTFKAQAYNQVAQSLANAQKVSAAVNASLEAQNPPVVTPVDPVEEESATPDEPAAAHVDLDLATFNLEGLNDAKQIGATYGNEGVVVYLNGLNEDQTGGHSADWDVSLETVYGEEDSSEWHLQWVDGEGNNWSVVDDNGHIVVVGDDGEVQGDWTTEAGLWADAEDGDVNAAVGNAIEDFIDAVVANAERPQDVTINVNDHGLDWTYPAEAEANA